MIDILFVLGNFFPTTAYALFKHVYHISPNFFSKTRSNTNLGKTLLSKKSFETI